MSADLIPFGKYKGQPVNQLQNDPQYAEWLLQQPWFSQRYSSIQTIIVNNFKEAAESPEHNSLQARFVSRPFAFSVGVAIRSNKSFDEFWTRAKTIQAEALEKSKKVQLSKHFDVEFEVEGWDVILAISASVLTGDGTRMDCAANFDIWARIELKPSLGEDFPEVMRQIKARKFHRASVLLIENFAAKSVSFDDVKAMFAASEILVLKLDEVKPVPLPKIFDSGA